MQVAFITVCKGRLGHVRETLPRILEQGPDEMVVVDYDCPDGVGAWVEAHHPSVKVVKVTDPKGFCVAKGRNAGAAATAAPWLCFIDADVLVQPGFLAWLRQSVRRRCFYLAAPVEGVRDPETWGTCVIPRPAFESLVGYDETFRGWGGEDDDLYRRLLDLGVSQGFYPGELVRAISHGEQVRLRFYDVKERHTHTLINACYMALKSQVVALSGKGYVPALELRQELMKQAQTTVLGWDRTKPEAASMSLRLRGHRPVLDSYRMSFRCTLDIELHAAPRTDRSVALAVAEK